MATIQDSDIADLEVGDSQAIMSRHDREFVTAEAAGKWFGIDPPKELMKYVKRYWHDALPRSKAEEVGKIPADAPTSYRDQDSGKYGHVVEITLKPEHGERFAWRIRTASGPSLAGGGVAGGVSKQYGYWIKTTDESWDE